MPLTEASVTSLALGFVAENDAGIRVHSHGLLDNETILGKLPHVLPGVCIGDLIHLRGIEPDSALSALEYRGGEPLLELEGNLLLEKKTESKERKGQDRKERERARK